VYCSILFNRYVNHSTSIHKGGWKARQGGNGSAEEQTSVVSFKPCATDEKAFNYDLQRPITDELYEFFKPFGYINKELGKGLLALR
jgi:phosphoadenosine phosphosulfate reductase